MQLNKKISQRNTLVNFCPKMLLLGKFRARFVFGILVVVSMLFGSLQLQAQQTGKIEYERKVSKQEVPTEILRELQEYIEEGRRIRYFKEFDGTSYSWEVKLIYEGKHFSIEYSADHTLLDIEQLVHWRLAGSNLRENLRKLFEQNYSRFKILRVQHTFLPPTGVARLDFIENVLDDDRPTANYFEIVAEVVSATTMELAQYEYIFDSAFKLISKRRIIPLSDVNLLF